MFQFCTRISVYYYSPSGLLYRLTLRAAASRKKRLRSMKRSQAIYRRLGFRLWRTRCC